MDQVYEEGIAPTIWDAGYKPHKIDEGKFTGGVVDRILAEIRKSKFVVADFTACDNCKHIGARGGVYFEAGFALGLGKTVFLTCRKNRTEAVHFDVNHLNLLNGRHRRACRSSSKTVLKPSWDAVQWIGPLTVGSLNAQPHEHRPGVAVGHSARP